MKHRSVAIIVAIFTLTALVFPALAKPRPESTVQIGNLIWISEPYALTWSEADDLCANLEQDGGEWRMPTLKELEALYANEGNRKKIKISKETGMSIWAVDGVKEMRHESYLVHFRDGFVHHRNDKSYGAATCVKPAPAPK